MSETDQYQAKLTGNSVARLVIEFQQRLRGVYPTDVMASPLCAVGPLQTMIGLGIDMGILTTPEAPAPVPKCTNWLGHKFEARYSSKGLPPIDARVELNPALMSQWIAARRLRDYEGDVCVRCGCTVSPTPNTEAS